MTRPATESCVLAVFYIACLIWALMLLGAWAGSLAKPGPLRWLALKQKYSEKIMGAMVREVFAIVAACSILAVALLRAQPVAHSLDHVAANLLCQVSGPVVADPLGLRGGIRSLAEVQGRYQRTLEAYSLFLDKSDLGTTKTMLSHENNPYALALLGTIYARAAEQGKQSPKDAITPCNQALECLGRARDWRDPLPGDPHDDLATRFREAVSGGIAATSMVKAKKVGTETEGGRDLLGDVYDECERILSTSGSAPSYANLLCALSLLGKYEEAEKVLTERASRDDRLSNPDRDKLRKWIGDLKHNDELLPLASHLGKEDSWKQYVDGVFAQ